MTMTTLGNIAFAGRLRHFTETARLSVEAHVRDITKQGQDDPLAQAILPLLQQIEELVEDTIQVYAKQHPVWTGWAKNVKGCGPMVVGAVLSRVDITLVETVSQMWAHFGFAPGQRREAGKKITFDAVGRTWCWRVGTQLLMAQGKFKTLYDKRKTYEMAQAQANGISVLPGKKGVEGGMSVGHVHARAMRYMIKTWLACAWLVWRQAEGLPIRPPYTAEHPGSDGVLHDRYYTPEAMTDR